VGAFIDLVGNQFERLAVVRRVENDKRGRTRWLCRCICGNEKVIAGASLRPGGTESCGCFQKERASQASTIDITGHKYGRLTVIERAGSYRRHQTTWLCRCDCGNEVVIKSNALRSGNTKSCGCLMREGNCKLPKGKAAFNELFSRMKRNAKERELEWRLTKEQIRHLTKQPCHYCGAAPKKSTNRHKFNGDYIYNGLDRTDNDKGYAVGNVVPCCEECNYAKRTRSVEQFRDWIVAAYQHFANAEAFATRQ